MKRSLHIVYMAAALAGLLTLTGCHKKAKVARHQAPPRIYRSPSRNQTDAMGDDPSLRSNPSASARVPEPAPNSTWSGGDVASTEEGLASWYGPPYHNRRAANGEIYDQNAMTAAHRTLPMGTVVRVTNLKTGQSATVKITDRGPFVHGRIIDLSLAAAKATGLYRMGVAKVRVEVFQAPKDLSGGKWCVQIGAFQHSGNAERLKSDLLRKYSTSRVIEFPGPTGHWVRINPATPDKYHASQIAAGIRPAEEEAQAFLVRLD